jgi:peptide/nickel transport system substrate-binding protein
MRFIRGEWVPGVKAVFEKFKDYVPRQEPASWFAGGKNIVADRVEWITIADPATASAALQSDEIDWLEVVVPDPAPVLRKNVNIAVAISDLLGQVSWLVMNHLFPPSMTCGHGARS